MKYKILTLVGISAVLLAVFFIMQSGNAGKILAQEEKKDEAEPKSKFDLSAMSDKAKVVFLHGDLGEKVWDNGVRDWFKAYNKENKKDYKIFEKEFPVKPTEKLSNLPCDYWNVWVNHAGNEEYKDCPTLEILTEKYDVIVFKHSMDASIIETDTGKPALKSRKKTIENYMLQYNELKKKMHLFPDKRFVIWTIPALPEDITDESNANRIKEFRDWVTTKWDEKGDNIFVWDFYNLQTDGKLYFNPDYIKNQKRMKLQDTFLKKIVPDLGSRIVQVIQGKDFTVGGKRDAKIILLHHSTGNCIWKGGVAAWFTKYNVDNKTKFDISERSYPKSSPYGWQNYPYDYWNIWVKNAGKEQFKQEDTMEILTKEYDVIIFKHCYPVSKIEQNTGKADVESPKKTVENYQLQYDALKKKMKEFPDTQFIVWTGAALNRTSTNKQQAELAKTFFTWVKDKWDEKGDNIFVWDFWTLETGDGLYLKDEFAASAGNSHPGSEFSKKVAPFFSQRIVNILTSKGDTTSITGE